MHCRYWNRAAACGRLVLSSLFLMIAPNFFAMAQTTNSLEQVAGLADPAVGRVLVRLAKGSATGSGFVLSKTAQNELLFITNEHVIEGGSSILVGFEQDGQVIVYDARVLQASKRLDLAVLSLRPRGGGTTHRVKMLPVRAPLARKGESVVALGFPGTSDELGTNVNDPDFFVSTLTSGTVSKTMLASWEDNPPASRRFDIVQHTASINRGNSGGPLLDLCGQVVGLNTAMPGRARDGLQANDTYWASGSPIIAQFLREGNFAFTIAQDCGGVAAAAPVAPPESSPEAPTTPEAGETPDAAPTAKIAETAFNMPTWAVALIGLGVVGAILGLVVFANQTKTTTTNPNPPFGIAPPAPVMTLSFGSGARHVLTRQQLERGVRIGRGTEADVRIDALGVSRLHAVLKLEGRKLTLTDLGSTNGTRVDDRVLPAKQGVAVTSKSKITLGTEQMSLTQGTGQGASG